MIRFIHAADLHLDTPFSGLEQTSKQLADKLREAPFQSFEKIVDVAIEKAVDFVVLAGDLYNTKRVNIKAQSLFIEQLNRLKKFEIPVYLIRGNHDHLTEETKTIALPFPENVYTYGPEVATHLLETKTKKRVALTGFSYDTQWVTERKINAYPKRRQDVDLQIGLLHGDSETSLTREAYYAPFSVSELREKNYDYWALGHIHQRQQLAKEPFAYYPGNIQGLHRNETGEKGCLFIEWTQREQRVEFIATAPVIWEELVFELADIENVSEFIQALQATLAQKEYTKDVLVNLTVTAQADTDEYLVQLIQDREFAEQLSQQLGFSNIWIASVVLTLSEVKNQQTLEKLYPAEWAKVLENTENPSVFNDITERIFEQIPSRYLNQTNTQKYRLEIIQKAIAKLHLK